MHQREQLVLWNHCGEHFNRYYRLGVAYTLADTSANENVQEACDRLYIHPWKFVGFPAAHLPGQWLTLAIDSVCVAGIVRLPFLAELKLYDVTCEFLFSICVSGRSLLTSPCRDYCQCRYLDKRRMQHRHCVSMSASHGTTSQTHSISAKECQFTLLGPVLF